VRSYAPRAGAGTRTYKRKLKNAFRVLILKLTLLSELWASHSVTLKIFCILE
jgi:hypothetical protein